AAASVFRDGEDLGVGRQALDALGAARAVAVARDDRGHGGAVVTDVVFTGLEVFRGLGLVPLAEVRFGEELPLQVLVGLPEAAVEHGHRHALSGGLLPQLLGPER